VRNSQLVYSGVDDNVERSRPVPSRLTVFLQPSRQRYRGRRPRKIDQLMPIVAEIEQIPSRRNSRLKSRAQYLMDWGDGSSSHAEKICAEKSVRYHRSKRSSGSEGIAAEEMR